MPVGNSSAQPLRALDSSADRPGLPVGQRAALPPARSRLHLRGPLSATHCQPEDHSSPHRASITLAESIPSLKDSPAPGQGCSRPKGGPTAHDGSRSRVAGSRRAPSPLRTPCSVALPDFHFSERFKTVFAGGPMFTSPLCHATGQDPAVKASSSVMETEPTRLAACRMGFR